MATMSFQPMPEISTTFATRQWTHVYDLCGRDDLVISTIGMTVFTSLVFWLFNSIFILLDLTGKPAALARYKVQPDKNVPLPVGNFLRAVRVALFNQICVSLPFSFGLYYVMSWRGCAVDPSEIPSPLRILLEMAVFVVFEEAGFYYFHRLLHHPTLYKRIHKQHHEWTAPIGIVSIYAHPFEHVLANLLPSVIGSVMLGSHLVTLWMWLVVVIVSTTFHHSGYHLPFMPSPEFHDFHHLKFNTNYGVLQILDRFHGTDAIYRTSRASARDRLLTSLTPMSQLVPDEPAKSR